MWIKDVLQQWLAKLADNLLINVLIYITSNNSEDTIISNVLLSSTDEKENASEDKESDQQSESAKSDSEGNGREESRVGSKGEPLISVAYGKPNVKDLLANEIVLDSAMDCVGVAGKFSYPTDRIWVHDCIKYADHSH